MAVVHAAEPDAASIARPGAAVAREPATSAIPELTHTAPAMDLRAAAASARVLSGAAALNPSAPPAAQFKPAASGISLVELPPEFSPRGPGRTHHAFGFRSQAAENWLKEQGVNAHNCMLPMLRLHTRVAQDGSASGTFWVYARCSLR